MKKTLLLVAASLLAGCQLPYLAQSAYHQGKILAARKPIPKVLAQGELSEDTALKLALVEDVKAFSKEHIGFTSLKNYSTYVDLGRPHVSYIVSASPKNQVSPHLWWFPLVGHVPYKGYFTMEAAQKEFKRLEKKNLDAYLRGVSAYSTLGWFKDPVLSSMVRMPVHNYVNILFHELTHANLYLKSSVDFNEKVATFLGDLATENFFIQREGSDSPTAQRLRQENLDTLLFSEFITAQIELLQTWYLENPAPQEEERQLQFEKIRQAFLNELRPKMHTNLYDYFASAPINNASLQQSAIYYADMAQYLALHDSLGGDLRATYSFLKGLEKSKTPEEDLNSKFADLALP